MDQIASVYSEICISKARLLRPRHHIRNDSSHTNTFITAWQRNGEASAEHLPRVPKDPSSIRVHEPTRLATTSSERSNRGSQSFRRPGSP